MKRGFTIIELMVVVSIIAILSAIGIATFVYAQKQSRDARRISDLRSIESALELYFAKNRLYPSNTLWRNSKDFPGTWITQSIIDRESFTPTFLPAVPNDPSNTSKSYAYWSYVYGYNYKVMVHMELNNKQAKNTSDGGVCDGWYEIFTPTMQSARPPVDQVSDADCTNP